LRRFREGRGIMKQPNATHRPLAYKDEQFLDSDEARPLRILAEYLEPLQIFCRERIHDTIVFFGSAKLNPGGPLGRYYEEARELARLITAWSKSLPSNAHRYIICTGGGGGIMEAANRGASEAGGRTIGLNIGLPTSNGPTPTLPAGCPSSSTIFSCASFGSRTSRVRWWSFPEASARWTSWPRYLLCSKLVSWIGGSWFFSTARTTGKRSSTSMRSSATA